MKKKILAAAVSAALVGGIGVKTASADAVVAPFFDTREGRGTVISTVVKTFLGIDPLITTVEPNWIYLYKDPVQLRDNCQHADSRGRQTLNDLGTFSLENAATIFADTTSTGGFIAPGFTGILAISTDDEFPEGTLAGESIIVDSTFGAVLGQRLINDPSSTDEGGFDAVSFGSPNSLTLGIGGLGGAAQAQAPVAIWHPTDILLTAWNLISARTNMFTDFQPVPDLSLSVAFANGVGVSGFFYDRDENLFSTGAFVTYNCLAIVGLEDFIGAAQLPRAANGGWAHVVITEKNPLTTTDDTEEIGLLVYKRETAGGAVGLLTSENRIDF